MQCLYVSYFVLEPETPGNSNLCLVDFGATGEVGTALEMSVDIKLSLAVLSQEIGALLSPFCAHMYLKTINTCASLSGGLFPLS